MLKKQQRRRSRISDPKKELNKEEELDIFNTKAAGSSTKNLMLGSPPAKRSASFAVPVGAPSFRRSSEVTTAQTQSFCRMTLISDSIENSLYRIFRRVGRLFGRYPWAGILFGLAYTLACGFGLVLYPAEIKADAEFFVPHRTEAFRNQIRMSATYGGMLIRPTATTCFITAKRGDILSQASLDSLFDFDTQLRTSSSSSSGEVYWEEACERASNNVPCLYATLFSFLGITDKNQVNEAFVKGALQCLVDGTSPCVPDGFVGGIHVGEDGRLTSADALSFVYVSSADPSKLLHLKRFEREARRQWQSYSSPDYHVSLCVCEVWAVEVAGDCICLLHVPSHLQVFLMQPNLLIHSSSHFSFTC